MQDNIKSLYERIYPELHAMLCCAVLGVLGDQTDEHLVPDPVAGALTDCMQFCVQFEASIS